MQHNEEPGVFIRGETRDEQNQAAKAYVEHLGVRGLRMLMEALGHPSERPKDWPSNPSEYLLVAAFNRLESLKGSSDELLQAKNRIEAAERELELAKQHLSEVS